MNLLKNFVLEHRYDNNGNIIISNCLCINGFKKIEYILRIEISIDVNYYLNEEKIRSFGFNCQRYLLCRCKFSIDYLDIKKCYEIDDYHYLTRTNGIIEYIITWDYFDRSLKNINKDSRYIF